MLAIFLDISEKGVTLPIWEAWGGLHREGGYALNHIGWV
jgi:hypothetical protein